MKKNKKRIFYLLVGLFFVILILLIKNNLQKIFPKKTNRVFYDLNKEKVTEIIIDKNNKIIKIYKKQNQWFLKKNNIEYHADEDKINQIINAFSNLEKLEIISTNQKKFKDLGIGNQKISLVSNDKKYQLFIGFSSSLEKNYLKVNDENEVFIGEGFYNLLSNDDFRDLKVALIKNEDDVNFIEIDYSEKKLILIRKSQDWYLNEKKVKKEKIDFLINDIATLKANDILLKENQIPQILPEIKLKIKEKNKEKQAYFIKKDENNYYLQILEEKNLYLISSFFVSSIKKEEKDFF